MSPNTDISLQKTFLPSITSTTSPIGINCSITCPENSPVVVKDEESSSSKACPKYFRWIQQDLNPWKEKGITKQMVESAESNAHMRIVIVNGRVYVKKLRWVYQTRDVYTVPELKIKPWETFKKDLEEGNHRVKWIDRIPYAYWKGNSRVSLVRKGLHKCNATHKHDWGALIYELGLLQGKTIPLVKICLRVPEH
ncbi:unnamed protein product [Camellia sinensis]